MKKQNDTKKFWKNYHDLGYWLYEIDHKPKKFWEKGSSRILSMDLFFSIALIVSVIMTVILELLSKG